MPDLSGNLASFSVRAVLELLAASGKSGELRLIGDAVDGRTLFAEGHIAYATTASEGDTVHELEALLSENGSSVDDVLREQLTEVFYELLQLESGRFEFAESMGDSGSDDHGFEVEQVLANAEERAAAWRRIRSIVPSTDEPYRIAGELPTNEVTLDAASWKLIASVGVGASVEETAEALGASTFRTAERFADLVGSHLLEAVSGYRPPVQEVDYAADEPEADGWDMPQVQPTQPPVTISREDLTREEMDEMIRNIGKGIYPTA